MVGSSANKASSRQILGEMVIFWKVGRCDIDLIGDWDTMNDAEVDASTFTARRTGVYGASGL